MEPDKKKKVLMMLVDKGSELGKAVDFLYEMAILSKDEHEAIMDPIIATFSAITTIRCELCRDHKPEKFNKCKIQDQHKINTLAAWITYADNLKKKGLLP